jgi:hypothetical protein
LLNPAVSTSLLGARRSVRAIDGSKSNSFTSDNGAETFSWPDGGNHQVSATNSVERALKMLEAGAAGGGK